MNPRRASLVLVPLAVAASHTGCKKEEIVQSEAGAEQVQTTATTPVAKLDAIPRKDFNRLAAELALPIFWSEDKNKNNAVDPDELVLY